MRRGDKDGEPGCWPSPQSDGVLEEDRTVGENDADPAGLIEARLTAAGSKEDHGAKPSTCADVVSGNSVPSY